MVQFLAVLPALTRARQAKPADPELDRGKRQPQPAGNLGVLQALGEQRLQFSPRSVPINPRGHQVFTDEYLPLPARGQYPPLRASPLSGQPARTTMRLPHTDMEDSMTEITLANILEKLTRNEDNKIRITVRIPVKDERFPGSTFSLLDARAKIVTKTDIYPVNARVGLVLDRFLGQIKVVCDGMQLPAQTKIKVLTGEQNILFSLSFALNSPGDFLKVSTRFSMEHWGSSTKESDIIRFTRKLVSDGCSTVRMNLPHVAAF
ncbi:chorismate mutase family protein [Komagataeibacter oboediens]|uniref:hypothetical protein n=1 Tax=Komagataeibacter oboediens TaxID=65958 RepID=UPI001F20A343|nr:hypothetical protein [Komagataeibacter oboediens]